MRRMCTREKITCVPAEPMSMPTLVSVMLSCCQSAFSSIGAGGSVVIVIVVVIVIRVFVVRVLVCAPYGGR